VRTVEVCWRNYIQRSKIFFEFFVVSRHLGASVAGFGVTGSCYHASAQGALSDDAVWRLSVCLSDLCRVHPVGGRRVRPAGWMARIGWSGPAQPAWLKAAAGASVAGLGGGISWRPPAYSLLDNRNNFTASSSDINLYSPSDTVAKYIFKKEK